MDWLRDAYDTFDVLLTYGDAQDPVFSRILSTYRDLARECGRSDDLEHVIQQVLERTNQPRVKAPIGDR